MRFEVRFYERGVGETMSSGTGSCAAAVASIHTGKVSRQCEFMLPAACKRSNGVEKCFSTDRLTLLCRGEFFV